MCADDDAAGYKPAASPRHDEGLDKWMEEEIMNEWLFTMASRTHRDNVRLPRAPFASSSSSISGAKGPVRAVESTKETYKHWWKSATNKKSELDSKREANRVTHHINSCPSMPALLCLWFLLLLTFFVGTRIGKRRSLWSFSVELGEEQGGPTNCKTTPVFKKMFLTNATNRLHVNFA